MPVQSKADKAASEVSAAMFDFALIALAAYRSPEETDTAVLEEAAMALESALATHNRWVKRMMPGA